MDLLNESRFIQFDLPKSLLKLIFLCAEYIQESMMLATVNIPPTIAHKSIRYEKKVIFSSL
jgi:hypothetical protein